MRPALTWAALALAAGCMQHSDKYCALHPDDTEHCGGSDGGMACTADPACASADPARPICDPGTHTCVACTPERADACTGAQPVCGDDHACRACESHAECASGVCEADGSCAAEADVAYVAASGTGNACSRAMPCARLIDAEGTSRPVIKVTGTIIDDDIVVFDARATRIYAEPGASVTRSSQGAIIEVRNANTSLAIHGLRIRGSTGAPFGHGILVTGSNGRPTLVLDRVLIDGTAGSAIRAADGVNLTLSRSVLADNNSAPGLYLLMSSFSITNTLIVRNGNLSASTGGAVLEGDATSTFEFNTVVDNISMGGTTAARGVTCMNAVRIASSIFTGNEVSGCTVDYSLFAADDLPGAGTGNVAGQPRFVSTTDPTAATYYRIMATSDAKDQADPAATLDVDIDGNPRPAGPRSDMGAHEVTP